MDRSLIFMMLLFGLALFGAYSIYQPFLLPIIVAMLLAMATSHLTYYLTNRLNSSKLATAVMVLLLALLILAPLVYIATNGVEFLSKIDLDSLRNLFDKLRGLAKGVPYIDKWAEEYLRVEKIIPYLQFTTHYIAKMGSKGLGFLKDVLLVITFYAIVVYYQDRFLRLLQSLIPVSRSRSAQMISDVSSTMEVVFYSIIVTAVFEGMLFGLFISHYGFNGLLFGAIYGFASLIPVVGGVIVWLPLSLYSWSKIDAQAAWTIAIYSVIVISIIADTFIKPFIIKIIKENLLHNTTRVNEFVIFFSILAGMGSYGFWGMILGPAITTFLIATSKIYIEQSQRITGN